MKTVTTLLLDREDLIKDSEHKLLIDIEWTDFIFGNNIVRTEELIMFIDVDSRTKIIKSRYGNSGLVR